MNNNLTLNSKKCNQHPYLSKILEQFKQEIQSIYQDNLMYLILFGS